MKVLFVLGANRLQQIDLQKTLRTNRNRPWLGIRLGIVECIGQNQVEIPRAFRQTYPGYLAEFAKLAAGDAHILPIAAYRDGFYKPESGYTVMTVSNRPFGEEYPEAQR